jgi:hypothetical protein
MLRTFTARMAEHIANWTRSVNLHHIHSTVVQTPAGRNAGVARKARSFNRLGSILALVLFVFAPGHLSAQPCAHPPGGLVGWWPLDETTGTIVSDHSGLGNNGTASLPIGLNTPPQSVAAFVGQGLKFYFGARVNVNGPSASLTFGTGGKFTIDAWIKSNVGPIMGNYNINTKRGYLLYIGNNSLLTFELGNGGNVPMTWSGPAINPNVWTFVAVVVDLPNKTVSVYADATGNPFVSPVPTGHIPVTYAADADSVPLIIGGCPGNPNGCQDILDEVEIFNRALQPGELQSIFSAGSTGKCKKGMTWFHTASNPQFGTITVGCGSSGPNPCDPIHGDMLCSQQLPLLCIYKQQTPFPLPTGLPPGDQNNRWSGGVVATTPPVAAVTFQTVADANAKCVFEFGPGWRVAEFHDGAGWNFQAYGGTVSAPAVPSTRFWVDINDQQSGNCWSPP